MFSLIWFVLLFSVSDASESTSLECDQQNITETNVTAEIKDCVVLNCSSEANTVMSSDSSFVASILEKVLEDPIPFLIIFGTGVLIGMLLFSIIACFVFKCPRKKSRNMHEGLEMVTTESFSKRDEDGIQDIQEDRTQDPEAAEGGAESNEPTKETMYADVNDTDVAPKETVYSNIDFSAMKERNPEDGRKTQETTETEYAEIKKGETKKRQDDDGEEGEMLKGSDEEEEIKEEDEEVKQGLLAEEVVGEGVPLYSSVDKMLDEN